MEIKYYQWPFTVNPHSLQISEVEGKWSFAVCGSDSYVMIAPGHPPEYVTKNGTKIIKTPLKVTPQN